jgi:hypothetical protein
MMMDANKLANNSTIHGTVWASFQHSFSQVQFLLDHNRLLIKEINQNHESKFPESLTRNVMLIRELNGNINKVVELYANLSSNFVTAFEDQTEGLSAVRAAVRQPPFESSTVGGQAGGMKPPPIFQKKMQQSS